MHEAVRQVGHRQTRNRGTLGGSLCHLDPSAEFVSVAAALDANISVTRQEWRRAASLLPRFLPAIWRRRSRSTSLSPALRFRCWPAGHGYAFVEFARRHGDFAIVLGGGAARGRTTTAR